MKKLFYGIVLLLFFVAALTLNLKNPQPVTIHYYFGWQWETSLVLALTAAFTAGLVLGWLIMTVSVIKSKRQAGKTKKQLAKVEKEVENLRTMPIKGDV
ncbi:MAG: LapA family protein [Gammaproteobacteria bacterium]|nr:LapA family protein [Gammaproteobacteria bacterium]